MLSSTHRLENASFILEIDPDNGVIRRLYDKQGQFEIIAEPRLAENYRLLLPLPGTQSNYILGSEQRLTSFETRESGTTLSWDGPLTSPLGTFDLKATMHIAFEGEAVSFRMEVENRTPYELAEVWYPILGGMLGLGERADTKLFYPARGSATVLEPFVTFPESMQPGGGVPGSRFPEYLVSYPHTLPMPWADFYNPRLQRGLYVGSHDTIARFRLLRFEMHPGITHNSDAGNWPRQEHYDERFPWGIRFHWVYFPYVKPGGTFEGGEVVVQPHSGDWHQAAHLYRDWFTSHFTLTDPRKSWMHQHLAVQNTMFLLPEDNVLLKYTEIPRWAGDALKYGVRAVLVSGWHIGGHDSHYPMYEPDPRLGTWDELAVAVQECHARGIKVFFFANFSPVDCDTDWYRQELHKYRSMNRWGLSSHGGFGMGTLSARMGFSTRPLTNVSAGFPAYRQIIVRQMRRLAEIGADGVHLDKLVPPAVDFNPDLELSPDQASWVGTLQGLDEILRSCREVNPDFCLSVESAWDRLLQYTDVAWIWHCHLGPDHISAFKYAFPQWLPSMFAAQPYDYNDVNNAVRFGFHLYVGPARYTASMDDEQTQPLSEYVREVLRIWEQVRDTIFDGEFRDKEGVQVEAVPTIRYNTHINLRTGKRACVLVNTGAEAADARLAFDGNTGGTAVIYQPFQPPQTAKLPSLITIPPERLAIVVEEE